MNLSLQMPLDLGLDRGKKKHFYCLPKSSAVFDIIIGSDEHIESGISESKKHCGKETAEKERF